MRTQLFFCTLTSNVNCCSTKYNLLYLVKNLPSTEVKAAAWALSSAPFNAALLKMFMCICKSICKLRKITHANAFPFWENLSILGKSFDLKVQKISLDQFHVGLDMCKKYLCQVLIWAPALLPACRMHCWKLNALWTKAKEPWAAKTPFCCTKCRRLLLSNIKMTNRPLIKLWLIKSSNFCLIMLIFRHVKH